MTFIPVYMSHDGAKENLVIVAQVEESSATGEIKISIPGLSPLRSFLRAGNILQMQIAVDIDATDEDQATEAIEELRNLAEGPTRMGSLL